MITESTYATTIRESKRWRERDLLDQVTQTVFFVFQGLFL